MIDENELLRQMGTGQPKENKKNNYETDSRVLVYEMDTRRISKNNEK